MPRTYPQRSSRYSDRDEDRAFGVGIACTLGLGGLTIANRYGVLKPVIKFVQDGVQAVSRGWNNAVSSKAGALFGSNMQDVLQIENPTHALGAVAVVTAACITTGLLAQSVSNALNTPKNG